MKVGCFGRGFSFGKLLSCFSAVRSPGRTDRMKRAETRDRDVHQHSKSAKQARGSGQKSKALSMPAQDEGLIKAEPSAREIAAARAARDRLYGAKARIEVERCSADLQSLFRFCISDSCLPVDMHEFLTVSASPQNKMEGFAVAVLCGIWNILCDLFNRYRLFLL